MLAAHVVPAYCAIVATQPHWNPPWNRGQRVGLWFGAFASTIMPDLDVIYNFLFRDFFNHSTLWTHSLFVHGAIGILWLISWLIKRRAWLTFLLGLIAFGGLSHLMLDVIAHGTPLFYPFSLTTIGKPPQYVVDDGVLAYLTHPIILLEVLLFGIASMIWLQRQAWSRQTKRRWQIISVVSLSIISGIFWLSVPMLQAWVKPYLP